MQYTFTFSRESETKFRQILDRFDPSEYTIIADVSLVEHKEDADLRYVDRQAIVEMDPEACLTLRLGMRELKIRRQRTEEELAEEKEVNDRNTVRINVQVPMGPQVP